jgi:hypothetical protein
LSVASPASRARRQCTAGDCAVASDRFQRELAFLGATSAASFVAEPEGNGAAERFIRTRKENLLWARH